MFYLICTVARDLGGGCSPDCGVRVAVPSSQPLNLIIPEVTSVTVQWLAPPEAVLTAGVLPVEVCLEWTAVKLYLLAESGLKAFCSQQPRNSVIPKGFKKRK